MKIGVYFVNRGFYFGRLMHSEKGDGMITYDLIRNNKEINTYIEKGNEVLGAMGYTDHGFAHATLCANKAADILEFLGFDERTVELGRIAGYMHDIGNCINRCDHAQSGALLAHGVLVRLGMDFDETADIICAIGHHDEGTGGPVSPISAALILADKSDVRRSRVRQKNMSEYDIHDRVNYAVYASGITLSRDTMTVTLSLQIDTAISPVMNYFEIFLSRMLMCRKAAEYLKLNFSLNINNTRLL